MELLRFLFKPTVRKLASRYVRELKETDSFVKVTFSQIPDPLFWPRQYPIDGLYQVVAETFDREDWHYYQKKSTEVESQDVVVDVGAAEGLFSLTIADRCRKVIMIEPNDFFVKSLQQTFASKTDKVEIINVAVGSEEGEIEFAQTSLSGHINQGEGAIKKITTIDLLLKGQPVSYLKADLEGFEIQMLKGAVETIRINRPRIAITTYHKENNADEIISFIKSILPDYRHYVKGIFHEFGKPVMIHFWIESAEAAQSISGTEK